MNIYKINLREFNYRCDGVLASSLNEAIDITISRFKEIEEKAPKMVEKAIKKITDESNWTF